MDLNTPIQKIDTPEAEVKKENEASIKRQSASERTRIRSEIERQRSLNDNDVLAHLLNRKDLSPTRNIIRTVDYNAPADWFEASKDNYPTDYFTQKAYTNGRIPKRFEDTVSEQDLIKMRNKGEYVEKMAYGSSVDYYKEIMGGIPPQREWIVNANYMGQNVRTNIVLAIALKELEYRLKSMPAGKNMSPKFNTLTSYNPGKDKHHGLAMAIDFDPRDNWLATPAETSWNIPLAMVQEAQKMGFDWGMYYFEGRKDGTTDAMHFAYRGRIPDLMKYLKSPEAIKMAKEFNVPNKNTSLYDYNDLEHESIAEKSSRSGSIDTKALEESEVISKIADKYKISIEAITEEPEKLRDILSQADIISILSSSDLIFNTLYPNEKNKSKSEIIKNETSRRIKAYSSEGPNNFGWYSLDYMSVNPSHEMQVGLGEILLDPNIKEIEVIRNGVKITGTRTVLKGRICFADKNGSYIATYTGDKFRIITNEELTEEENEALISQENEKRRSYEELIRTQEENGFNFDESLNLDQRISRMDPKNSPISDENVSKLIDQNNPPFNAEKILKTGQEACSKFQINYNIYKSLIMSESTFNWEVQNESTKATGFGQFLIPAWTDFANYCQKMPEKEAKKLQQESGVANIRDIFIKRGENINNDKDPRKNPILNAYATAWYMNEATKGILNRNASIQDQAIVHALCHHDGPRGGRKYLKFLDEMRKRGANTQVEMRQEYIKNPNSFDLYDFQKTRGIDFHLSRYFNYAITIAVRASGADQTSINEAKKRVAEQEEKSPFDGQLDEKRIRNLKRASPGTRNIPYRFTTLSNELSNGGSIGFLNGSRESKFDENIALTQLQWLEKNGIQEIISLVHGSDIQNVIQKNKLKIKVGSAVPLNTSSMTTSNEVIIDKIAQNINKGIKTYVHCRHGAHRAIISSALGLLKAGKTNSLDQAFNMAGGTFDSFYNKDYIPILQMALSHAKDKGHKGSTANFERKINQLKNK